MLDGVPYLGFIEWAEVIRYYYFFEEFEVPFNDGQLQLKDILRAIDDQSVPTQLNPATCKDMFAVVGKPYITFPQFAGLQRIHRFMMKYDEENPGYLNPDEFMALIMDPQVEPEWGEWLDTDP